jgi:hypothetical protein
MTTNPTSPLVSAWCAALASAGLASAKLISDSTDSSSLSADGEACFLLGTVILRLVRDRGQDFVDVRPASQPSQQFSLDDIGIAQGWRSLESVIARQESIALSDELTEIARHKGELEAAFDPEHLAATEVEIVAAREKRQRSFLDKLARLADEHPRGR